MKVRAQVLISGNVHGVFFRSSVRNQASLRQLRGWVRNTKQGKVEAVFEGERDLVKQLIDYCKEGPEGSQVEDVQVIWGSFSGKFEGFEIRY